MRVMTSPDQTVTDVPSRKPFTIWAPEASRLFYNWYFGPWFRRRRHFFFAYGWLFLLLIFIAFFYFTVIPAYVLTAIWALQAVTLVSEIVKWGVTCLLLGGAWLVWGAWH